MEDYTEEVLEAVQTNIDYLEDTDKNIVAVFLETLADSLYDGELLLQVANALRDVEEGVA